MVHLSLADMYIRAVFLIRLSKCEQPSTNLNGRNNARKKKKNKKQKTNMYLHTVVKSFTNH